MKKLLMLFMLLAFYASSVHNTPQNCQSESHRAFDFWLGEWQVTTANDNIIRNSKISLINDGCTLLEEYRTPSGYQGKSLNMYDVQTKQWHQTWTDNSGLLLILQGQFHNNQMVLEGQTLQNDQVILNKITWTANKDGSVRQHWQTKPAKEDNWQTAFDGLYRKVK